MNFSAESPLENTDITREKISAWADSHGAKQVDVYGKPSNSHLQELERIRNLSKELQNNLNDLENSVYIPEEEKQAMNPTAPILDYSEHHEFVSANQLDDYYAKEDQADAREEEQRRLTKDGRISLKASRVVEKIVL
ncbi:unnamed protein product [Pieris brassicae]|uniref:Uncharacterized protein n=1 Tax=Pieris brassicae TaxID=7116 RepID=A0A9P0TPC7_PIEBR|nr:unnamed protein product [Pieris brassicae]